MFSEAFFSVCWDRASRSVLCLTPTNFHKNSRQAWMPLQGPNLAVPERDESGQKLFRARNTKLLAVSLPGMKNVALVCLTSERVTFWLLLCLSACPNSISCQSYSKLGAAPGGVAARSVLLYLLARQGPTVHFQHSGSSLPTVAISWPLRSPWSFARVLDPGSTSGVSCLGTKLRSSAPTFVSFPSSIIQSVFAPHYINTHSRIAI